MINKKFLQNRVKISFLKFFHFYVSCGSFFLFWFLFRYGTIFPPISLGFRYNYFVLLMYGALLFFFNRTYNSYLLGYSRIQSLVIAQFLSQFFSISFTYLAVSIAWNHWDNPLFFVILLVTQAVLDIVWSIAANAYFYKLNPSRKTILVYRNSMDRSHFKTINGKATERLYHVEEELQYDGEFSGLEGKLEGYDAVFAAGINFKCRNEMLKYCKNRGIPVLFFPFVGDVIVQDAIHIQSFDSPVLYASPKRFRPEYAFLKRYFDIVFSLLGIVILSPLMLIIAITIKLYDKGPVLYRQIRLTERGRQFTILKFRSMNIDAEKDGVARLSTGEKDERITPVGRIIRKFRLDEFPQLFNILVGDMSFVGPRPERPEIAEQYSETIPEFNLRLQVKAGLTGYAQIYGKYNSDPYEKLVFDLLYINNMNEFVDLQLLFATLIILFLPESTEGVAAGQTTAMNYENGADSTESGAEMVGK